MNVIGSGGFGCIVSPQLKCSKTKKNKSNIHYISKIVDYSEGIYEVKNIQKLLNILTKIPNYRNYFLIDNIKYCVINKKDIIEKIIQCKNKFLENRLLNINIPYGGINVNKFINNNKNKNSNLILLNKKLIDLLKNGIVPMNNLGVYHCDMKPENILVDIKDNHLISTKVIDWGFSLVHDENKPYTSLLHFNMPFSIILFNKEFITLYNHFLSKTTHINYLNVRNCIIDYVFYYINKIDKDSNHLKNINKIITILFLEDFLYVKKIEEKDKIIYYEYTIYFIVEYLTKIVLKYTQNGILDLNKYFNELYCKNVDLWGFITIFYLTYDEYFHKQNKNKYDKNILLIIKNMFITNLYSNPLEIIQSQKVIQSILEINKNMDHSTKNNKSIKNQFFSKKHNHSVRVNKNIVSLMKRPSTIILPK